ncbi:hypothetical protein K449DRAFT_331216, partial [Hypoxylon sp. EC38]
IQTFLNFISFYKRFIKDYLKIITLFTNLLKRKLILPFNLPTKALKAFKRFKEIFLKVFILKYFNNQLLTYIKINIL